MGRMLRPAPRSQLGSLYGGLCLGPVNTAAVHGVIISVGCAGSASRTAWRTRWLLPHVSRFNFSAAPERYADISVALGVAVTVRR